MCISRVVWWSNFFFMPSRCHALRGGGCNVASSFLSPIKGTAAEPPSLICCQSLTIAFFSPQEKKYMGMHTFFSYTYTCAYMRPSKQFHQKNVGVLQDI